MSAGNSKRMIADGVEPHLRYHQLVCCCRSQVTWHEVNINTTVRLTCWYQLQLSTHSTTTIRLVHSRQSKLHRDLPHETCPTSGTAWVIQTSWGEWWSFEQNNWHRQTYTCIQTDTDTCWIIDTYMVHNIHHKLNKTDIILLLISSKNTYQFSKYFYWHP